MSDATSEPQHGCSTDEGPNADLAPDPGDEFGMCGWKTLSRAVCSGSDAASIVHHDDSPKTWNYARTEQWQSELGTIQLHVLMADDGDGAGVVAVVPDAAGIPRSIGSACWTFGGDGTVGEPPVSAAPEMAPPDAPILQRCRPEKRSVPYSTLPEEDPPGETPRTTSFRGVRSLRDQDLRIDTWVERVFAWLSNRHAVGGLRGP